MKKFIALILALCNVLAFPSIAFAEAKFSATKKTLYTTLGDWKGYFFAKIENTGDTAGYVAYDNKLVGFDADDNIILSENYVSVSPSYLLLNPGEYAYAYDTILEDELESNTVCDYKFSVKADNYGYEYEKLPCTVEIGNIGVDTDDNYIYVTITNNTEAILYEYDIVTALYDGNEELIYVGSNYFTSFGIHPGSTVTIKDYLDSDLVKYYAQAGITPATADVIVYVSKD